MNSMIILLSVFAIGLIVGSLNTSREKKVKQTGGHPSGSQKFLISGSQIDTFQEPDRDRSKCITKEPNMKYSNNKNYTHYCGESPCNTCYYNTTQRINQSATTAPSVYQDWSVIGKEGPGITDTRQEPFRKRLAEMYPTMGDEELARLAYELNPQPNCQIEQAQQEQIEKYQKQISEYHQACQSATEHNQSIFKSPLGCYQEPPLDPTSKIQPVRFIKPEHLEYKGTHSLNECGKIVPSSDGDFLVFSYGKKY